MTFKTEKISTGMPLQGFRRLKSGNPHEYWAAVCKKDNFQWITVELGWTPWKFGCWIMWWLDQKGKCRLLREATS